MIYQEDRPTALSVKENFDSIYINNFSRLFLVAKEDVLFDEEAENIVQDIFLMLWEKREALRVDVSLTAYLFTLVKNKCIDFLRHQMVYITIEKYTIFQLKSIPVLIVCEDKKSYLNAG